MCVIVDREFEFVNLSFRKQARKQVADMIYAGETSNCKKLIFKAQYNTVSGPHVFSETGVDIDTFLRNVSYVL